MPRPFAFPTPANSAISALPKGMSRGLEVKKGPRRRPSVSLIPHSNHWCRWQPGASGNTEISCWRGPVRRLSPCRWALRWGYTEEGHVRGGRAGPRVILCVHPPPPEGGGRRGVGTAGKGASVSYSWEAHHLSSSASSGQSRNPHNVCPL